MTQVTKSFVFTGAWAFARKAAAKFGGSAKQYFAASLKLGYAELRRKGVKIVARLKTEAKKVSAAIEAEKAAATLSPIDALNKCGHALYMDRAPLTSWEKTFINDMAGRLAKYGDAMKISEKQADVLRRIAAKV